MNFSSTRLGWLPPASAHGASGLPCRAGEPLDGSSDSFPPRPGLAPIAGCRGNMEQPAPRTSARTTRVKAGLVRRVAPSLLSWVNVHVVRLCRSCTVWGPPEGSRTDDEQLRRARRAPARRKGPEVVALRGRGGYGSVKVLNIAAATVDWLAEELAMLFNDIKGSFAEVIVSGVATVVSTSYIQLLEWTGSLEASTGRVLAHGRRLCGAGTPYA